MGFSGHLLEFLRTYRLVSESTRTATETSTAIPAIIIETKVGIAVVLPAAVESWFSDSALRPESVAWDSVLPTQNAPIGSFTVNGTVAGTAILATANVTVGCISNCGFESGSLDT